MTDALHKALKISEAAEKSLIPPGLSGVPEMDTQMAAEWHQSRTGKLPPWLKWALDWACDCYKLKRYERLRDERDNLEFHLKQADRRAQVLAVQGQAQNVSSAAAEKFQQALAHFVVQNFPERCGANRPMTDIVLELLQEAKRART